MRGEGRIGEEMRGGRRREERKGGGGVENRLAQGSGERRA